MSVTLTGLEIRDLADAAGFSLLDGDFEDELKTEFTIISCPKDGVLNDKLEPEFYHHVAYITEYPEEGSHPLGNQVSQL